MKIIRFLDPLFHLKIVGHSKKCAKKKVCFNEIALLIIMKMKIRMRNRSHGSGINRPRLTLNIESVSV